MVEYNKEDLKELAGSGQNTMEKKIDLSTVQLSKRGCKTELTAKKMKTGIVMVIAALMTASAWAASPAVNLVPWPKSLSITGGEMALSGSSRIVYSDSSLSHLAEVVAGEIEEVTRLKVATLRGGPAAGDIYLKLTSDSAITGEKHKVTVGNYATAEAANYSAVAMASVTLIQAIMENNGAYSIAKMSIIDEPDAGYRGFMVDVARSYHSPKVLKELVDMCRLYKIRYMQIHLTDDQAFTFPSTAYPKLTNYSSYSYTPAELTDLVDYADRHGVTLIPEIETPAHATSFTNAMPELFASPGGGIVNFADPAVWYAMDTIINEVCDVFQSSPYIHLGADEANIWGLAAAPEFRAAIATHGVGDIEGLFNYYISRLDDTIKARGKSTLAWEGFNYGKTGNARMDPDISVMMFDNAKNPQAYLDAGHKVINASWNPMYIVGFEGRGFGCPAHWIFQWNRFLFHGFHNYPMTWARTRFNPPVSPTSDVIGAQMCSWEMWERREIPRVRFRIAPFADRIWIPDNPNDFAHFKTRYHATDVLLDYLLADHKPPAAPADTGASDGFHGNKIRIGWKDGGNYPRKYALYRNTTKNPATATLVSDSFPKTTTFYEDHNVTAGQTYYYWVKAWNKWGWSDFSAAAEGKTGRVSLAHAYEPFDYPAGTDINGQTGGTGFSSPWDHQKSSGPLTIIAGSLSYPGVPSEAGALKVNHTKDVASELTRHLSVNTGRDMSDVWMSFMVKGEKVALGWITADLNSSRRFGKHSYNGIGIHYDTSVFMEDGVTYFIVFHADCRPGNDTMYLWVNPPTDQKPSIDDYDAIWETSDIGTGDKLRFNLSGTGLGKYIIDEIRIGTTWEDAKGASRLDTDAPTPNPMKMHPKPVLQSASPVTSVFSEAPSANWEHSMFSGNGEIGVMARGFPYTEVLHFSHAELYLPVARGDKPLAMAEHMPHLRRLCLEGEYTKACLSLDEIRRKNGNDMIDNDPFIGAFQLQVVHAAAGNKPTGKPTSYKRSTDFMTGVTSVQFADGKGGLRRDVFASRPDRLAALRIQSDSPRTTTIRIAANPSDAGDQWIMDCIESTTASIHNGLLHFSMRFRNKSHCNTLRGLEGAVRIIVPKGVKPSAVGADALNFTAKEALVLVSLRPVRETEEFDAVFFELAGKLGGVRDSAEGLLARHAKIHGELMGRVSFSLRAPDSDRAKSTEALNEMSYHEPAPHAQIERAFQAGRYAIISSTGVRPPNIVGLWAANWRPPFRGAYTANGNMQVAMQFLQMGSTPELMHSYFDWLEKQMPGYRESCRLLYGIDSWHLPAQSTTNPEDHHWFFLHPHLYWYGGAPWACLFYYDQYRYSGDTAFLRDRAYPLMKEAAVFFEEFLFKSDDGSLCICPSYSPENAPGTINGVAPTPEESARWRNAIIPTAPATVNATCDIAAARQLLTNLIRASEILDVDETKRSEWQSIIDNLPPYEVSSEDGSFREWLWPGLGENHDHRHVMHLYPVYDECPPEISDSPAMRAAVSKTIEKHCEFNERTTSMAFGYILNGISACHVYNPGLVERIINFTIQRGWSTGMGSFHDRGWYFCTDISGGFPYLVSSSLVYSDLDGIRFFPARPASWKQGSISGLSLRGDLKLAQLTWSNGKAKATILPGGNARRSIRVTFPDGSRQTVAIRPGRVRTLTFTF